MILGSTSRQNVRCWREASQVEASALSLPVGTALILIGVLVNVFASVRHVRIIRALNQGEQTVDKPSTMAIVVALLLAAAGLAMAVHLGRALAGSPSTSIQEKALCIEAMGVSATELVLRPETLARLENILQALAWQDGNGRVWLSHNDPAYLKRRFGLSNDDIKTIAGVGGWIEQAVK